MTISDIVIIVVVACVGLMGFIKGMKKSSASFLKFAIAVVAAFFLTKTVANLLLDVDFVARSIAGNNSLFGFLRLWLPDKLDFISTSSIKAQVDGVSSLQAIENVRTLFNQHGMSGSFMSVGFMLFSHALINPTYLNSSLPAASDIIALELSYALFCVIVFFVLFLVLRLILALFGKIFKSKKEGKKNFLLRLAAIVVGAAKGVCYTILLFCLASLFSLFSFMSVVNNDINNSSIGKPLLNTATTITSVIVQSPQSDSRYKKLIKISGYDI